MSRSGPMHPNVLPATCSLSCSVQRSLQSELTVLRMRGLHCELPMSSHSSCAKIMPYWPTVA